VKVGDAPSPARLAARWAVVAAVALAFLMQLIQGNCPVP
jgi:hypothetical protein